MKKIVLITLALFFMTINVSAQSPGIGQSEIIVIRESSTINTGFRAQVFVNGQNRLNLPNGAQGRIIVPDGEHVILVRLSTLTSNEVRFNVHSGSITFSITSFPQRLVLEQQSVMSNTRPAASTSTPAVSMATSNIGVENSLERAAVQIANNIPERSRIAIVNVAAEDNDVAEFIANELEFILVNKRFMVIDRSQLDQILQEQNFHLSGYVDDAHAVSIGRIAGADVIITGAVTGTGNLRRLRLRALDTETAQILSAASERY